VLESTDDTLKSKKVPNNLIPDNGS
jgi:hypothetical protein